MRQSLKQYTLGSEEQKLSMTGRRNSTDEPETKTVLDLLRNRPKLSLETSARNPSICNRTFVAFHFWLPQLPASRFVGGGKGRHKVGSSVIAGKCMRTRGYRVVVQVKLTRNSTVSKENKLLENKEETPSDAL
jgi:hypothetical protein